MTTDYYDDISGVVAQLTAAVTNAGLYAPTHPQVERYIEKSFQLLERILSAQSEITIFVLGEDLIAENRVLAGGDAYIAKFSRILQKNAVERITFAAGLKKTELEEMIRGIASSGQAPLRSSPGIRLGKVQVRVRQEDPPNAGQTADTSKKELTASAELIQATQELSNLSLAEVDELKNLYLRIKNHKKIDVRGIDDIVKSFIRGFRRELNPMRHLASLKSFHEYTFTHVTNVGILTMSQAERLGFSREVLHQIGLASLLHDVGKLFVPQEVLDKQGKLSDAERKLIETHSVKGARYLMGLEGIPKIAVLAALEHHVKFDGSGYPVIKGGWQPNIVSQMITIADVFDAMRSKRSYQEAMPMEKIESVLRSGSGKAFNPQLVDHFLSMVKG